MPSVKLLSHTPDPEKTVAAAARLCYSNIGADVLFEDMSRERAEKLVDMLAEMGHESPLEHVSFTFTIEGVSRVFLAQMTRHRIASYSVQSQRYVRKDSFDYILPPSIAADPEAAEEFERAMNAASESYERLAAILEKKIAAGLTASGVDEEKAHKQAEKQAIEDARFVLPNACDTKMIVTMNARSLRNFFRLRCCNRAQWEIRAVADEMLRLCKEVAPTLFAKAGPPCVAGPCPEGKMSCGHPRTGEFR
ncbi:MAG TPA: FAD-dependent thymidylate synthase [Oscillospiraceae bacterium]|nr:FAD-dependent thymidylate synthase [Oscillospiraceae bacterium]HRW56800.1 FAD-dependent thymidylate synthase [Oscillospiraceae bacterium]